MSLGIVIVDHGSRMAESNQLLVRVAEAFAAKFAARFPIVEPAHMELANPSIAEAYDACVKRGASHIIVVPYFLGRGKHWSQDIPHLSAQAAAAHPGTTFKVTDCLGFNDPLLGLLAERITEVS